MKLVLFDIDGTLLWTDGAGRRAIHAALLAEMGTAGPIDGYRFDGKTDPQIVQELLTAAGHPDAASATHIELVCRRYVSLLQGELEVSAGRSRTYPGVPELLELLERRADAVLGLLTGNLEAGARIKLEVFGLNKYFPIGAYGSDNEDRNRLLPLAAERFRSSYGKDIRYGDCVVIGDTPRDIFSAKPYGAMSIATATGPYPAEALRMAKGTKEVPGLAD